MPWECYDLLRCANEMCSSEVQSLSPERGNEIRVTPRPYRITSLSLFLSVCLSVCLSVPGS